MRKMLVLILCLVLILTGCSTKQKLPKDISEDFYNDMLEANELIEKSIATRYDYLFEYFKDKIKFYSLLIKKDLTEEDIEYINKNNIDINKKLTSKEIHIFEVLTDLGFNLGMYHASFDTRHDPSYDDFNKDILEDINKQYKQFKTLLEIEEP